MQLSLAVSRYRDRTSGYAYLTTISRNATLFLTTDYLKNVALQSEDFIKI
jgi:hypothetical protein